MRLAGRSFFTKPLSHQPSPHPRCNTSPAPGSNGCRFSFSPISTLFCSHSIKGPKIAQSGAAVGPHQAGTIPLSCWPTPVLMVRQSSEPPTRPVLNVSSAVSLSSVSPILGPLPMPHRFDRRVGQAAVGNVWSNCLRAGVLDAWQNERVCI